MQISELPGLGSKSRTLLATIDIHSRDDLNRVGPVQAFMMLRKRGSKPSLNLLYAMVGALTGQRWQDVARSEKASLLLELEGFADLKQMLAKDGIDLEI